MLYFVRYGEERELKQITYSTSEMCVKRNLITGDSPANITLDCLNWLSNIVVHTASSTWCHLGILRVGGSSNGSKSTFNCKFPNDH